MINKIIDDLYLKENITDTDFYQAVYKIHQNYFIVRPKKGSPVEKFINGFNKLHPEDKIYYSVFNKNITGFTVEEMFLKGLAYNKKNNMIEYLSNYATFIPKSEEVLDYLDSKKTIRILIDEEDKKDISHDMFLFTPSTKIRMMKNFVLWLSNKNSLLEFYTKGYPKVIDGYVTLSLKYIVDVKLNKSKTKVATYTMEDNKMVVEELFDGMRDFFSMTSNKDNVVGEEDKLHRRGQYSKNKPKSFKNIDFFYNNEIEEDYCKPSKSGITAKKYFVFLNVRLKEEDYYRIAINNI